MMGCSISDYSRRFNENYEDLAHLNPMGDDIGCIAQAAVMTAEQMAPGCRAHPSGNDCSPAGYVRVVAPDADIATIAQNVLEATLTLRAEDVAGWAGCRVGAFVGAVAGGLSMGSLGAQEGVVGTAEGVLFGAGLGAFFGCREGAILGRGAYRLYEMGEFVGEVEAGGRALLTHSRACAARPIPIQEQSVVAVERPPARGPLPPAAAEPRARPSETPVHLRRSIPPSTTKPPVQPPEEREVSPLNRRMERPSTAPKSVPEKKVARVPSEPDYLSQVGDVMAQHLGNVSGVVPLVNEVRSLDGLIRSLLNSPEDAPLKIVSHLLRTPEANIRSILGTPEAFAKATELVASGNIGGMVLGALSIVGIAMAAMQSITWFANFLRDPKEAAMGMIRMPVDLVRSVANLGKMLLKDPVRAAKTFAKTVGRMPERTVKNLARSVGLRKKKKRKFPVISAEEQKRLNDRYKEDLVELYLASRKRWVIDPFKSLEQFHQDLMSDWAASSSKLALGNNYLAFPTFLKQKVESGDMATLNVFSPSAHLRESIVPPEVAHEIGLLMQETLELGAAYHTLIESIEVEEEAITGEIECMAVLGRTSEELSSAVAALSAGIRRVQERRGVVRLNLKG